MNIDTHDLESVGVNIPSGQIARTAQWVTLLSGTERLTDLLAREYLASRLDRIPTDSALRDPLARHWARRAVSSARNEANGWDDYADAITARLTAERFARGIPPVSSTHVTPLPAQIVAASVHPMGLHRWSLKLEHDGSSWLKAYGLPTTRPDTLPKGKHLHVTTPDRVAYRGEARFTNPQPCRYGPSGHQPAWEMALPLVPGWTLAEYLTTSARERFARSAHLIEQRDDTGRLIGRHVTFETTELPDDGTRHGWRGLRRITWQNAPRARGRSSARDAARSVKRSARATVTTAKRGPAVGPWSLSDRSLPVAVRSRGLETIVDRLEIVLRSAADHALVTFGSVTVELVGPSSVLFGDRAYPIREWSRRAALAGIDA